MKYISQVKKSNKNIFRAFLAKASSIRERLESIDSKNVTIDFYYISYSTDFVKMFRVDYTPSNPILLIINNSDIFNDIDLARRHLIKGIFK